MKLDLNYLKTCFGSLFEQALLHELLEYGHYVEVEQGKTLIRTGGYIHQVPIIISGSIKIVRSDSEGREVLLYYIGELDSCAISLSCCLDKRQSEITAIAEEPTQMISIPFEKVEEWITKFPTWKQFVFKTYQKRFDDLITVINELAFHKLDERLISLLRRKSKQNNSTVLNVTHEELALELATSREVVSRLLKQLEKLGHVKLARNRVELQ